MYSLSLIIVVIRRLQVIVGLPTRTCNGTSAPEGRRGVRVICQPTNLSIGANAADASASASHICALLDNATFVEEIVGLDAVGNTEVAEVAAAF